MTPMEVAIYTSRIFFVLGTVALLFFFAATLICVYKKKDYGEYFSLMIFSAIIVIMAKFNLFVPII